jgi:hypothetical protein
MFEFLVAATPDVRVDQAGQRDHDRDDRWLVATITATSILLPTLGISVVVVLVVEFLMSRLRRAWA